MKALIIISLLLISTTSFGQKIKFQIDGQSDTTVNLVRYFGKGLYYADTAEMKNGFVEFDGTKQKAGILALYLPGQNMLEFVYNDEDIFMEAELPDLMGSAKIKKSEENKIFYPYIRFMASEREKANRWLKQREGHDKGTELYNSISDQIDGATKAVEDYQKNIIENHWDLFVSRIVKMSMDVNIPDTPLDADGKIIDSNFRFLWYRSHYFDNIDLKDDRLVRTPIFHNKLANYFSNKMMLQHWDTVIYYAYDFCDRLLYTNNVDLANKAPIRTITAPNSDMFQYCVSWITSTYEKSKIMGMDKVFVYMGKRYYCSKDSLGNSPAFWMEKDESTKTKLNDLCDKVSKNTNLVMGAKPPNISLRDTTDVNWVDFYSLDNEYTILYFWDPECGHCKKITPKLQVLYEKKFRDRNIDIFAVGKAVGEDFEKWKKFVRVNKLEFINVAVTDKLYTAAMEDARQFIPKYTTLESLNYQKAYDIYATPKVFILDKDKKIIAKGLTISQLEDLLDRLQEKRDAEKLFPPEKDVEEEQMH